MFFVSGDLGRYSHLGVGSLTWSSRKLWKVTHPYQSQLSRIKSRPGEPQTRRVGISALNAEVLEDQILVALINPAARLEPLLA